MLRNYLKIAFRNLWRNKLYATINILGLALGMTCSILLYLYIQDELGFESSHTKADRVYRAFTRHTVQGGKNAFYTVSAQLAPALQKEYPEIETVTRVYNDRGTGHLSFQR